MRRISIEWDEDSIDHIWKHQVDPEEVDETIENRHVFRRGRGRRYYVLGRSHSGRYLFIVLARKPTGNYRVITTRDMTTAERQWLRKKMK